MRLLRIVAMGVGAVCAAAVLLAQGGRWSGQLDVLTHFTPAILALAVLVLVVALLTPQTKGGTRLAALGGIGVLGSVALIAPAFFAPSSPLAPVDAPNQIKLIQYNVEHDPDAIPATAAWLAGEDPDIVVLEDGTPALEAAILSRLQRHVACGQTCNVRVFSRAAPTRVDRPRRGRYGLGPAIVVADFAEPAGGFTLVGVHYARPQKLATHKENTRRMLQIVEPLPRSRLILAGDFNSTPWSFARRREEASLGLERRTRSTFTWPANPTGLAFLAIDHVYAGPGWRTVSVRRGPRLGSDHYPVVAVLAAAPVR